MAGAAPEVLLRDAAAGMLPDWSVVTAARREHIARVAALMDEWSAGLGLDAAERTRWLAAAWLHDALRDAHPDSIRHLVPAALAEVPGPLLHGPAAARMLRDAGVDDDSLLDAIAFHTLGHPDLDRLGRALYLADFLDPGRDFMQEERAAWRARMPDQLDAVLVDVLCVRLVHLLKAHAPIRPDTMAFWNALTSADDARAA